MAQANGARVAAERSAKEAAASRARSDELARSLDDVRGAMERAAAAGANTPTAVAAALDGIKRELRDELRSAKKCAEEAEEVSMLLCRLNITLIHL